MARVHHRPAPDGRLAIVASQRALLVGSDAVDVDALYAALHSRSLTAVLAVLGGASLASAPDFALAEATDDGWRLLLRGDIAAVVDDAPPLTGGEVVTWTEVHRTGDEVVLGEPGSGWLPIDAGAVRAGGLRMVHAETVVPSVDEPGVDEPGVDEPGVAFDSVHGHPIVVPESTVLPESTVVPEATVLPEATVHADTDAADGGDYDFLFGQTVIRSVQDAAVVPDDESEADAVEPEASDPRSLAGDHDGETVLSASVHDLRAAHGSHGGPRHFLELSTGGRAELDGPVVVGRMPSGSATAGVVPQLVTIAGAKDISRSHVRFTIEGDSVVVTDLNSRNGTIVRQPGKNPQQLRASEPTVVLPDTVVDLGGGVTLTVHEHAR